MMKSWHILCTLVLTSCLCLLALSLGEKAYSRCRALSQGASEVLDRLLLRRQARLGHRGGIRWPVLRGGPRWSRVSLREFRRHRGRDRGGDELQERRCEISGGWCRPRPREHGRWCRPRPRGRGCLGGCLVCGCLICSRFIRSRFCRGCCRLLLTREEGLHLLEREIVDCCGIRGRFPGRQVGGLLSTTPFLVP